MIIALLNETLKLNFLNVYKRHKPVLFVMRYWSRGVSGALEKRELELDSIVYHITTNMTTISFNQRVSLACTGLKGTIV